MIITREAVVKITEGNYQYFTDLGYDIAMGELIIIPIELLSKGSHVPLLCKCDDCGVEKEVMFKNYINYGNSWGTYYCRKCSEFKRQETVLKKYGVKHPMLSYEIVKKKVESGIRNKNKNKNKND